MHQELPFSTYLGRTKQFVRLKPSVVPKVGVGMQGIVVSHPFHPPGTEVTTSPVTSIEGSRVQTRSSVYELC